MTRGEDTISDVFNFIKQYYETLGYGPSRRDISEACELPLGVVQSVVVRLASNDQIYYSENIARSIRPKDKEQV